MKPVAALVMAAACLTAGLSMQLACADEAQAVSDSASGAAVDDAPEPFTHVVSATTVFYKNGPQQMRPADGRLTAGTRVSVVRSAGSYSLVRALGQEVYVDTSALRASTPEDEWEVEKLIEANNQFAIDLYHALAGEQSPNRFFSPYSLSAALAMTLAGARGDTADQMRRVLHVTIDPSHLNRAFRALAQDLTAGRGHGYELAIANRLWGQQGYQFLPEYLQATQEYFGARLAEVDFRGHAEESRGQINRWVMQQTRDRIQELIPAGALDPMTSLVLTNAIYFKGDWTAPFKKEATQLAPFHVGGGKKVRVPLMYQQERFLYAAMDDVQLLEMSYGSEDLAMFIVLPNRADGLAAVEAALSAEKLDQWCGELGPQPVKAFIPRFKLTEEHELTEVFSSMGMPLAFSDGADFSGMTTEERLRISAVMHKAYVDVNEKGTEAAAATGIAMMATAIPAPRVVPVFRADHPFLFLIRDRRSGSILFIGRFVEPKG